MKSNLKNIELKFDNICLYYFKEGECIDKLQWDKVKEIFAFKRDLFTVDLICIGFRLNDEGTYYEIDEEMVNYDKVVTFLNSHFDGIIQDWFSDVAHPAFKTNLLSLWGDRKIEGFWK